MKYNTSSTTVYIGIDSHKESFSLCCYINEKEQIDYPQKVDAHYSKVINYIEAILGNFYLDKSHYISVICAVGDDAA